MATETENKTIAELQAAQVRAVDQILRDQLARAEAARRQPVRKVRSYSRRVAGSGVIGA
jgi:hypothetical protein